MEDCVHLNSYIRGDGDDGGEIEYPAEEVEGAGEEAEDAAVAGARSHGGPVVDTTRGGNRRREFRDRGGDEAIIEACNQELIKNTSWAAIIYNIISTYDMPEISGHKLIETAIEPPNATHALSMVSANPQILRSP